MPMDRNTRLRRRRQARRRGLIALAVIATVAIVAGVAVVRALTGGGDAAPSAPGDGSGQTATHAGSGKAGGSAATGGSPTAAAPAPVRVVSGGDVMTDRVVKSYINANGAGAVLSGIAPQLQKGDVAWVNLESPLSNLGSPEPGKDYVFEGPPSMVPALAAAGIDLVTLGNNHTVDYGQAALADTIKRLEKAGVQVVGAGLNDKDAWTAAIVKTSERRHHRLPRLERRPVARLSGDEQAGCRRGPHRHPAHEAVHPRLGQGGGLRRRGLPLGHRVRALPLGAADQRGARRHRRRRRPGHRPPPARAAGVRDVQGSPDRLQPRRPGLRPLQHRHRPDRAGRCRAHPGRGHRHPHPRLCVQQRDPGRAARRRRQDDPRAGQAVLRAARHQRS